MRLAAICAFIVVCAIAWLVIDRARDGALDFDIWRALSGQAHGGRRVRLNDVGIYYETFGSGPPVLVLHGGKARLETMHNQIVALAPHHFVVAPDSRGHGRSTDGTGPLHYDDMATDMISLMDRMHLARADVVGWSDGGIVGLDMAMRHPDRVSRLVVIGTNYDVSGLQDLTAATAPRRDPMAFVDNAYRRLQRLVSAQRRARERRVAQLWRAEPHFTLAQLNGIRCPVLVIAGENDIVRREHTNALAHAIHGAREVILPGADHMAPLRDPKPLNDQILGFLGDD